jgi:hypothetical protein
MMTTTEEKEKRKIRVRIKDLMDTYEVNQMKVRTYLKKIPKTTFFPVMTVIYYSSRRIKKLLLLFYVTVSLLHFVGLSHLRFGQ